MIAADAPPAHADISSLLRHWLAGLAVPAQTWLDDRVQQISAGALRLFFATYSAAPRYTGRAELVLGESARAAAQAVRPGWQPRDWSLDQVGRAYVLLALPAHDAESHAQTLRTLAASAELRELIALYRSLPLLPHAAQHRALAVEGVRSNMMAIFNAVALDNPYPAEQFEPLAWNQLVLKAVFLGSPLYRIQGLDQRANAPLARMLIDYAHERWAAGRSITPELWRVVGPFASGQMLRDLPRALQDGDPLQQEAAALALSQSPAEEAAALLAQRPDLQERIGRKALSWDEVGARWAGTNA
jgi:hypothetical protein